MSFTYLHPSSPPPPPSQDAMLTEGEIAEAVAAANTKAALDRKSEDNGSLVVAACLFGRKGLRQASGKWCWCLVPAYLAIVVGI